MNVMFANGVGLAELQTKSLFLYQMLGSGGTAASFPNTIPQPFLEALQLRAHWEVELQHFEDAARKQWLLHTTSQGSSLLLMLHIKKLTSTAQQNKLYFECLFDLCPNSM